MELNSQGTLSSLELSEVGITDGLVQWYPLNGDANDYSGSGNHGTVYGPIVTSGLNGKLQYSFDGSDDYILMNNSITPTLSYTVILWAKPNVQLIPVSGSSGNRKTLIVGPGPVWNPGIWTTSDIIRPHCDTQYRDFSISWSDLTWKMTGQIFNGTKCFLIWNGEILDTGTTTSYSPPEPSTLILGADSTSGSIYNWNGNIQDVRIYDRQLSQQEIKILYDLGLGSTKMITTESNLYISGILDEVTM